METKIYGASDDLIEFEGEYRGEAVAYGTDRDEKGVLLVCSDGTLLEAKYGKNDMAIWGINLIKAGELFERIDLCDDENADPHSDIAYLKEGIKWIYWCREWIKVD